MLYKCNKENRKDYFWKIILLLKIIQNYNVLFWHKAKIYDEFVEVFFIISDYFRHYAILIMYRRLDAETC